MRQIIYAFLVCVVFASFSFAEQKDLASLRKAIDAANGEYIALFKNPDPKAFGMLFTEDAVVMEPGRPAITGRKQIGEWLVEETKDSPLKEGIIQTLDVYILGDAIYETGTFKFVSQAAGKDPSIATGKYLDIWKQAKDGSLKIYREVNIANDK